MGKEASIDKPELSTFVNQEGNIRCTSALGQNERSLVRALFQASSDEFLRGGDISLLQRLDRLDNILSAMEDKAPLEPSGESFRSSHGSKRISWTAASLEKRCKSTESVLEEVEEKGTIVERVSELEKRLTKLQQVLVTKSGDSATYYPDLVEVTSSHRSLPSHGEHEEFSPDDTDVEKHEVTSATSHAPLEHLEDERQHEPPSVNYSKKHDISPQKEDSSPHMEGQQGRVSSEGASMEEVDSRARRQQSKKNGRIKKWISKRLHFGSSPRQGKHICSTGHCWSSSHKNSKSCWNMKKGGLHASSDYTHFAHNSIYEDSP